MIAFLLVSTTAIAQEAAEPQRSYSLLTGFFSWLPLLILVGLWFLFFKKMGGPSRQKELLEKQDLYLDRAAKHMDEVEAKLDAILEELRNKRNS